MHYYSQNSNKAQSPKKYKTYGVDKETTYTYIQNYKFCDLQLPLHALVKISERLLFFRRIGSLFWSYVRLTACFLFFLAGFILGAGRHIVFVILFSGRSVRMLRLSNMYYTACFYLNSAGCLLNLLFYLKFTLPCAAVCLDILIKCQLPAAEETIGQQENKNYSQCRGHRHKYRNHKYAYKRYQE